MEKRQVALAGRVCAFARALRPVVVTVLSLGAAFAVLGSPADIARGVAWLQAQVQTPGLLITDSRAASSQQARCETAHTLLKLAGNSAQVSALVAALQEPASDAATESLSCWQQLRQQLGETLLTSDVERRRVSDQGYAPVDGFGVSTALDTGWALSAQFQNLSATDKAGVLAWLQSSQGADGSFSVAGKGNLLATAAVLRSLNGQASGDALAAVIATKAAAWLLAAQSNGSWLQDVATTSIVFEAVQPYTGPNPNVASSVNAYLLANQQSDGSWAGDPYVTAVALRALALTAAQPVDPTMASTSATVVGAVIAAANGQPLQGVTVNVAQAGGGNRSAQSGANGAFVIQGIVAGPAVLSASLGGYQTATATADLMTATTAVFSPILYANGVPVATDGRVTGTAVAFGSGTPLPGVAVQASPATGAPVNATTDGGGHFDIAIDSGSTILSFSLAGYIGYTQQVIVANGSNVNLGTVPLQAVRQSSTLRGTVNDFNGQPVIGAKVLVGPAGVTALSNDGGAYSLTGLTGTSFNVQVSAAGYATQTLAITVPQPSDIVQDVALPPAGSGYLTLSNIQLSDAAIGLRQDVTATVVVSNDSTQAATDGLAMDVVDPGGQVVATVSAIGAAGNPGVISLQPGAAPISAYFKWNSGRFPAGDYQLIAKLYVPGTMSHATPGGVVLGSLRTSLGIRGAPHFTGSVTADPPIMQAGANQPIALSALIQNDGNTPLPAQAYQLAVIDAASGQTVSSQSMVGEALTVSQLQPLSFSNWTPTTAGNFKVQLTASGAPGSSITTTVYVGAAGQANWTVDKPFVPAGTQTVRGTVHVTGQNAFNGSIQDPLAPLVKQALATAVAFADTYATNQYRSRQCYECHVEAQSITGGEHSLKYVPPASAVARAMLVTGMSQNIFNPTDTSLGASGPTADAALLMNGGWPAGPQQESTYVGLWGLSQWHDPAAINYTRGRLARYLIGQQASDGSWAPDVTTTSWWSTKAPLAAINVASLASVKGALLTQAASFAGKKLVNVALTGLPSRTWRLATDASGNLYAASSAGVYRIPRDGGAAVQVSSLNANTVLPLPDGRMLIGNSQGMYVRQVNGTISLVGAGWPVSDLTMMADGSILMATPWWDPTPSLNKVTPEGGLTGFGSTALLAGKSGTTAMPDGSVMVANGTSFKLLRLGADGGLQESPAPALPLAVQIANQAQAISMRPYQGGLVIATERGLFFYDPNWIGQRWSHEWVFGPASTPDGRLFVNYAGGIYEVKDRPFDTIGLASQIDATVDKAASWLKAGAGVDQNSNVDLAFQLMGLSNAKDYFRGTARETEFDASMQSIGAILQARQRADGSWVWKQGTHTASDPMVTAMVGVALDTLNPSPNSAAVRKAVQYLLGAQQGDGTWKSPNFNFSSPLIASTWVEIWLPMMLDRLGHLDSAFNVTFPPNVAMTAPSQAPTSTSAGPDGSTTYQWNFTTSGDSPAEVAFDLTLTDLQVDEVRPVAQTAELAFKNSFTGGTVSESIGIPTVAVTTHLTGIVSTDKPSYTGTDTAIFTATVANAGNQGRAAQIRFTVLDAGGGVVQVLPIQTLDAPAGSSAVIAAAWPAGAVLAGSYHVKADLLSPTGLVYGSSTASFAVSGGQSQASTTRILTDRASYTAAQVVQVTDAIANLTGNTLLENLQAVTTVTGSANQNVFTKAEGVGQLAPGGQRQYGYSIAASSLPAGVYRAAIKLLDASANVISQSEASFTILGTDQSGVGVTGSLRATPSTVLIGQPAALTLIATNGGSAMLASAPVTLRVIDPASGATLGTYSQLLSNWAPGGSQSVSWNWLARGVDGQIVVAAATVNIAGRDFPLAQATVRLAGEPKLTADPPQLDFPSAYAGESVNGTLTLSSIGTVAAASPTFSLGGQDASQFVIPQGGCTESASLPIGATCTLTVSWRPQTAGSHAAEVQIGYGAAETLTVPLAGQARPVVFGGTVGADATEVEAGQSVGLSYTVSNPAAVPSRMAGSLSVRDPVGQTLSSWPLDQTIGGLATYAGGLAYTTGPEAQTLTVALSQQVGTGTQVLATSSFTVVDPPVPVGVGTGLKGQARILVLVSCPPGLGSAEDAACVAQRMQAITSYLGAAGYAAKAVASREAFVAEMRCGSYNTYWISGGAVKLDEQDVGELREAVWRGEALWMDGVHDSRNLLLHPAAGVKEIGKLSASDQAVQLAEGVYPAQTLPTLGQPTRFEPTTGHPEGLFTQVTGQQEPVPAIVSNDYGRGKSLLFAFDLAAMVIADATNAGAQLRSFIGASASSTASGSPTLTLGDLAQLSATVGNLGTRTVAFRAEATLPAGLASVGTQPPAQLTGNTDGSTQAIWNFSLPGGASQELGWLVRAAHDGSYSAPLAIFSLSTAGSTSPPRLRAGTSFTLEVRAAQDLLQEAAAMVMALEPAGSADKSNKTKAVAATNQAIALHNQGNYEQAIVQWLAASDALIAMTSMDAAAARGATALATEASTDALCIQRCGSAACR